MGLESVFLAIAAWIIGPGVSFWLINRRRLPYDPNADRNTRLNQEFSSAYPVLEKTALENRIRKNQAKGLIKDLVLPWPSPPAKINDDLLQPISERITRPVSDPKKAEDMN